MPAYTSHGWPIPESTEDCPQPQDKSSCGGVGKCTECIIEASVYRIPDDRDAAWTYDYVKHNERTLFKVDAALRMAGLDANQRFEVVRCLQNQGILFRERT
jgi:hypothetical protein